MTKRKEAAIFFKLSARDRASVEREWEILNPGAEFDDDYGDYLDVYYEIVKPKNATYRALRSYSKTKLIYLLSPDP
jgi:hypothetical protein